MVRSAGLSSLVSAACVIMLTACGGEPATGPAGSEPSVSAVPSSSALMTVDQQIVAGQKFAVSFTGRLSTTRGGYLFVKDIEGVSVALLRSDGNSEIPMGYELNPDRFGMLDDGLSGTSSTFLFPPELPAGAYALCTANSLPPEECVSVEVSAS